MSDREICGVCRGSWPCECAPHAAPVVLMESVDDEYAAALAKRMRIDPGAPLQISAYVPDAPLKVDLGYGDGFCGHRQGLFEVNLDKRIAWCRTCGTILDPYGVLKQLANSERRLSERLKAAQELERREADRETQRRARATTRRHRYASYSPRTGSTTVCATCGESRAFTMHTQEATR